MNKDLKLIIRNILILLVLLVIFDVLMGFAFAKVSDIVLEKTPNSMRTEYTIQKVNSEVIILGSSRANHHYNPAIIEDSLNLSTFNCGKDGKPFYYAVAMLDAITQRYLPKIVIFDIEPFLLKKSNKTYDEVYELNPFYYKNEFFKEIVNQKSSTEKIKMLSSMYRYNSRFVAIFGKLIIPDYIQDRGYDPLANKGYKYISILPNIIHEENDEIDEFTIYLLERTIKLAKENNIKLVFSISPRYQTSNYKKTNSYNHLMKILNENKITLIDNGDISLISDPKYYKDAGHLNSDGADMFTELLVKQIGRKL